MGRKKGKGRNDRRSWGIGERRGEAEVRFRTYDGEGRHESMGERGDGTGEFWKRGWERGVDGSL